MDVREATTADIDDVRRVAHESLTASYGHALDDELIDEAVEHWYDTDELVEELRDEDAAFVVAVDDGEVVGFAQSYVVAGREVIGEIDWLHVSPSRRGAGIGTALLRDVERRLLTSGVGRIEGRVLAANEAGTRFYEDHGFDHASESSVDIGGQSFVEHIFTRYPDESVGGQVVVETRMGPDGTRLFVNYDETDRGSTGPFFGAYVDRELAERYGWFCGNCESFDISMDTMGRVVCGDCSNTRRPTRWDAAYL